MTAIVSGFIPAGAVGSVATASAHIVLRLALTWTAAVCWIKRVHARQLLQNRPVSDWWQGFRKRKSIAGGHVEASDTPSARSLPTASTGCAVHAAEGHPTLRHATLHGLCSRKGMISQTGR